MKFKPKRSIIELKSIPEDPTVFVVTVSDNCVALGQHITLEELKEKFTPVDGEALNLVDPNRNKRLFPSDL